MFSPAQSGANAYARVGVETGVMGASPHKLISLLYQGARKAVAQARMHLQMGNVGPRCEAIGKAIRIVESGLQLALNVEAGGEVAQRLNALYGYITRRLLEANMEQSESKLVEAEKSCREALAMRRRLLGDEHPAVGSSLSALAAILEGLQRYDEAEKAQREALTIQ